MRVIAGTAKGRRLVAPPGDRVRPTGDRVREALFGMLEARVGLAGQRVADLCCGTGALGIEALSRGAASVVFVDSDRASLRATSANLVATGFDIQADGQLHQHRVDGGLPSVRLERSEAVAWAGRLPPGELDLVVVDPPYAWLGWSDLLAGLAGKVDVVGAESDREIEATAGWGLARARRHGGTVISVLTASSIDGPA